MAYSPDGSWLAAGSSAELSVWDLPEGTLRHTFDHVGQAEETDWITSLDVSPDGRLLAAGRRIGVLEVWQLAPGMVKQDDG